MFSPQTGRGKCHAARVERYGTEGGCLLFALETFAAFSRLLCGGDEVVQGGVTGMLIEFTGVGGALPDRGREKPEENRQQL